MPRPVPLREVRDAPPPPSAQIIDARFKVVGRKRRVLAIVWRGLTAVFWAAVIGFLIPPAWMLLQYVRSLLSGS
jgi:hypothetical protein